MSDPGVSVTMVCTDGGTQTRARLNKDVVSEYAEVLEAGGTLPPVVAFYDGSEYWLGDGFHRVAAAEAANVEIGVEVRQGTRRDAILFSAGANSEHGLRRTNADKRRAVLTLLKDEEWGKWSNREIARRCRVGRRFVDGLRHSLGTVPSEGSERTFTTKHGTTATMDTSKIGKSKAEGGDNVSESNAPPSRPGAPPRPRYGKQAARMAINRLKEVQKSDIHRVEGWRMVLEWIAEQSYGKKPVGMNLIASYTKEEAQ